MTKTNPETIHFRAHPFLDWSAHQLNELIIQLGRGVHNSEEELKVIKLKIQKACQAKDREALLQILEALEVEHQTIKKIPG